MSLNSTPSAQRVHIGLFGCRNAGKSSLINALTGQSIAIVSDVPGTTTDPVLKSMELLPLGPVVLIDTPGLDDAGELGSLRVEKSYQALNKTEIAVLVVDASRGMSDADKNILQQIRRKDVPYLVVFNKADEKDATIPADCDLQREQCLSVSALTGRNIEVLKERLARLYKPDEEKRLVGDLLKPLDFVVLVVPLDASAPKGRLILPQQQTIRDALEVGAVPIVVRDTELALTLQKLGRPPRLVITDSQAFGKVAKIVPEDVPMTSFSILFARYKGGLRAAVDGALALDTLKTGERVLIAEGCTHHRQCGDIGTVKLPEWIRRHSGAQPEFVFTSGGDFPADLSGFKLIIHCGGCMLNDREMQFRLHSAQEQGIPMTNYGIAIAHMNKILQRSIEPLAHTL